MTDDKEFIRTADIETAAKEIAAADELDIDLEKLDSRQIGRILGKLRFEKGNEGGTHKKGWKVSRRELVRFVRAHGLATDNSHISNVTSVTEGHNVTSDADESGVPPDSADTAFAECADYFERPPA